MFRKGKKRHSSSSSQSSEISTKSKSVDSSLGGLSRSSTVASLDTDSTKSSGQSNNNSDTCAEFRIKYVGAIEKLKFSEGKSLEGPLDLINYIDVAQQDGKLPFVPLEEEFIMGVSKYGIKVSTSDQYDVLHRHALYLIIRMVCYDDGLGAGKSLLALKTTDASNEEYSLWVYQCSSLVRFHVALLSLIRQARRSNQRRRTVFSEAEEVPPTRHLMPGRVGVTVSPWSASCPDLPRALSGWARLALTCARISRASRARQTQRRGGNRGKCPLSRSPCCSVPVISLTHHLPEGPGPTRYPAGASLEEAQEAAGGCGVSRASQSCWCAGGGEMLRGSHLYLGWSH